MVFVGGWEVAERTARAARGRQESPERWTEVDRGGQRWTRYETVADSSMTLPFVTGRHVFASSWISLGMQTAMDHDRRRGMVDRDTHLLGNILDSCQPWLPKCGIPPSSPSMTMHWPVGPRRPLLTRPPSQLIASPTSAMHAITAPAQADRMANPSPFIRAYHPEQLRNAAKVFIDESMASHAPEFWMAGWSSPSHPIP
jgi:hypothetical protein